MSDATIKEFEVARLSIKRGEVLFVKLASVPNRDVVDRVHSVFQNAFKKAGGKVPPIIVVGPDVTIEVASKDRVPPALAAE